MKKRLRPLISKFLGLRWRDRALLVEAVVWLAVARLSLLLPFRWIAPRLGETMSETPQSLSSSGGPGPRVSWAIGVASSYTPWATRCLAQAIAAKAMLRVRGLPTTLYLGTAKNAEGEMTAHAWLRCGNRVVTGEAAMDSYAVIARFADPDRPYS
jgi:hypothetical protein